jgi:hypothetical protein
MPAGISLAFLPAQFPAGGDGVHPCGDINNGIYFLARRIKPLIGFDELSAAVENGTVTFGGALEFKRVKGLPGM